MVSDRTYVVDYQVVTGRDATHGRTRNGAIELRRDESQSNGSFPRHEAKSYLVSKPMIGHALHPTREQDPKELPVFTGIH